MNRRLRLTLGIWCVLAPIGGVAGAAEFEIDPVHTSVIFAVDHFGFSKVWGRFNEIAGKFSFDENDPSSSRVEIRIPTASVDTNHEKRDGHLRSPDFFNSAEFPEMVFRSERAERTGERTGRLQGQLTLLGVTAPVTLDVTFNQQGPHPSPQYAGVTVAGFSATGTVERSRFGMKYGEGAIGDRVILHIDVEGHHQ